MLIVYLQDKAQPAVLPRIIDPKVLSKGFQNPTHIQTKEGNRSVINRIDVNFQSDSKIIIESIVQEANDTEELSINTESLHELFQGFIHFYFNGGGFDFINDVIHTRNGKITKFKDIPSKSESKEHGVCDRVYQNLKECIFPILDPFDFSYAPSIGFNIRKWKASQLSKLQLFCK